MKKIVLILIALSLAFTFSQKVEAQDEFSDVMLYNHTLIDLPTAYVLDYYSYNVLTRAFSDGGVRMGLMFGVLPNLNIGANFVVEQFIGSSNSAEFLTPTIFAKYRFFDGTESLPGLSVGYDGQGYFYDHNRDEYIQQQKGLYLVTSKEVLTPGFNLHLGVNMPEVSDSKAYIFTGADYTIDDKVTLIAEADNIKTSKTYRFNLGIRVDLRNNFYMDFAVRDLIRNTTLANGIKLKPERIFQLGYQSSF